MEKLPLKVRVAIRDLWEPTTSPALRRLKDVLGTELTIDPEWGMLYTALGGVFNDDTRFVQQIAILVAGWAEAACRLCDDELLGEALVDKIEGKQLHLFLNVSSTAKPTVEWSKQGGGFIISIPSVVLDDDCREYFEGAIRGILQEKPIKVIPPTKLQDSTPVKDNDDWETVHVGTFPKPERLPLVSALPRPDDLLLRPPYNLRVQSSRNMVIVESSHSPTLQLLHDYLTQWCRVNHNRTDKPPLIEIKLHQSPFALGQTYDRLELEGGKQLSFVLPTASIVLNIVEGVLGYERVDSTASSWLFCRTEQFRS